MATENTVHHSRLSTLVRKNGENGHATLSNRLSRAEYEELRGRDKISEPFEGNSGIACVKRLKTKL